jgi:cytochrome bd ubiquinol oxidase subunit I
MSDPILWHRLQFAFTITYHYLFPQLTMGLALLIVVLKTIALRSGDSRYDDAARFWIRIFGINFAVGVVTGIPMEFQFGIFGFFLESTFLGLLIFGERRLGRRSHYLAAIALFVGSWLSGYFIIATNAFMQHPVGHEVGPLGVLQLAGYWAFLLNPWALAQYAHNMMAAVVTGSFVMAAVGAYYALERRHRWFPLALFTARRDLLRHGVQDPPGQGGRRGGTRGVLTVLARVCR